MLHDLQPGDIADDLTAANNTFFLHMPGLDKQVQCQEWLPKGTRQVYFCAGYQRCSTCSMIMTEFVKPGALTMVRGARFVRTSFRSRSMAGNAYA